MLSLRTPPTYQHTCRLPISARGDAAIARPLVGGPARALPWLHPGLGYRLSALPPPTVAPGCPSTSDACAHSPACLHHSREAPFFRGLDTLAVHAGGTRLRLSTLLYSQLGTQRIVGSLPHTCISPLGEVPIHNWPGRQVTRQHAPGATTSQQVEDGIGYLPRRVLALSSSMGGRRKQWLKQHPLLV